MLPAYKIAAESKNDLHRQSKSARVRLLDHTKEPIPEPDWRYPADWKVWTTKEFWDVE